MQGIKLHNHEIESYVLGALLGNNMLFYEVQDSLSTELFYDSQHKLVYEAFLIVLEKNTTANERSVGDQLCQNSDRDANEIRVYLSRLVIESYSYSNMRYNVSYLVNLYMRRELVDSGHKLLECVVEDVDADTLGLIKYSKDELGRLSSLIANPLKNLKECLSETVIRIQKAYESDELMLGTRTYLTELDKVLGGFQKSDLIILGARPSMGKTALATTIALNIAEQTRSEDGVIMIFSIEMSAEHVARRMISMKSGVPVFALTNGMMSDKQMQDVFKSVGVLEDLNISVEDRDGANLALIRTRLRKMKRIKGVRLAVIDYLQLIEPPHRRKVPNRNLEIGTITRELKELSRELNIPIMVLSQLSRAGEGEVTRKPQLSDLRESGSIEQDADVVMFLYREEYYLEKKVVEEGSPEHDEWLKDMERVKNRAEIIIGKHRNGAIGSVTIGFDQERTMFYNLGL